MECEEMLDYIKSLHNPAKVAGMNSRIICCIFVSMMLLYYND
jgi:hypothetical protein